MESVANANQVLEGLFEWLRDNQWFFEDKITHPDVTVERAAQAALLDLAEGDVDAYRAAPAKVRELAAFLLTDFLAKLMGPLAGSSWPVSVGDGSRAALQSAAWTAIGLEIRRVIVPNRTIQ